MANLTLPVRIEKPTSGAGLILEAWAEGLLVGAFVIMAAVTVANMRRGVLLHKLILIELLLGMPHGTFIFANGKSYGLYLSITAVFLNLSWIMHNVIAWVKNKPFLTRRVSFIYIGTVMLSIPYWIVEIYANFAYFNNINYLFHYTRPYEAIFRDPWWIFTTINLFYNIVRRYGFGIMELIKVSPRFGILLLSMLVSVVFIIVDICSVTDVFSSSLPEGINPFWKLAFIFKCLTDTIILDDFKTALDRLKQYKLDRLNNAARGRGNDTDQSSSSRERRDAAWRPWNESKGVIECDKPIKPIQKEHKPDFDKHIDVEMAYWKDRGEGSKPGG
ncbi:DNA repair protein [Venturia nashicola]|uniref:DNA repair protein n=1 Tax=Venturia nashicola TaxID=86259 RepID=A0A4Z1NP04_9PEZI|nr:DNA repair protein [Venturia nashicola]TLD20780.1 DNA repair protein [Venturia nashicola]